MADVQTQKRPGIKMVISKDRLTAILVLRKPESGTGLYELDEILNAIETAGVTVGIDESAIEKCLKDEAYDEPVQVAKGTPIIRGEDARIEFTFKTDEHLHPEIDENGVIDYREMGFVQNTTVGTVLAKRIAPTNGVAGVGVDGGEILAPRGRDKALSRGENTSVSEDGNTLTATKDGAIVHIGELVSVSDLLVIKGDVDFNVGNIDCIGSVKVNGDIHSGFTIKVGGNLEVNGNVEDAAIQAGGNIMIKGGCFGKGEASMSIYAKGDVVVKYAEGQNIESGNQVVAAGELLNCNITAKNAVSVKGKNGKIIGGNINAGKEIRAAFLGSDAGTATKLTVAYDAELMKKYRTTDKEIKRLDADLQRVKESLYELYRAQMDAKLPPQKEAILKKLEEFQKSVPGELEELRAKLSEYAERMKEHSDACIIGEDTIYPGVQAHFGIVYREIEQERKKCKLMLEVDHVVMSEFKGD